MKAPWRWLVANTNKQNIDWKHTYYYILLEPSCCKKCQKSPSQETDLGNRGRLKVLGDTKLILND